MNKLSGHVQTSQPKPNAAPSKMPVLAFLGGSFNPVHSGHLQMAAAVDAALKTAQATPTAQIDSRVYLLPSRNPDKSKHDLLDDKTRLHLLDLAAAELNAQTGSNIAVSAFELALPSPKTYTIDTVRALKNANPNATLIFILGQDSLLNFRHWQGARMILDYVHLWVFERDMALPTPDAQHYINQLPDYIAQKLTYHLTDLWKAPAGKIYLDKTPILPISSSQIRRLILDSSSNKSSNKLNNALNNKLPKSVLQFIVKNPNLFYFLS